MKTLQQFVNKMVLEEALKKAEPLAKQMGLGSVPEEMLELIYPNLNYAGQFNPALYARFQSVKRLLKELSEQITPKHGHIVKFTNQYGSYDESALLLREGEIRRQNLIACVGGKTLGDLELREFGLDMHIGCGGPFEPVSEVHIASLSEFDFYETSYRFWGQTPCGNGMITISFPMKRWFLSL
ncbi:hypothetical protein [Aeromonas sp. Y311-2]|uniref:hypothetical protein n=1 Tax=Aeromonas sp. Y311-2 TaxID=2990507 RepID=UPI0022E565AC|nr:hypothetical protein [Aeromonas sp. Y311-2]